MSIDRHKMGAEHEAWLATVLNGRQSRGSGNHWRDQMDGRTDRRFESFAWAWDGKSTMGMGIAVTREMLKKAVEQAGGERPMVALRFYADERLRSYDDWILVKADDFLDLQEMANEHLGRDTP